ncbi:MAG: hypothetical protein HN353_11960 [Bdellovibrionales bacterium]|jgi:hypothetical protein|nr:hypothetical protein [Bdellovibrionales bacterium]MBT3527492.1 hypothetical protein [Bdellovibrionales bacterium]MBT7765523.1 hypothetical protein [Bdellovibrionales bacterium]
MESLSTIERNFLGLQLTEVNLRELLSLQQIPCSIYGWSGDHFEVVIYYGDQADNRVMLGLIKKHGRLFVLREDLPAITKELQNNLLHISRSVSQGDPEKKIKRHLNLLTVNMHHLYRADLDDHTLRIQFQSARNLAQFLLDKPKLLKPIFHHYRQQMGHHYLYSQPILSSLALMGVLRESRQFTDKEIENLFITSFFKDVGMSLISGHSLQDNHYQQNIFSDHPANSHDILKDRVPLAGTFLSIIKNHHPFAPAILHDVNDPNHQESRDDQQQFIVGSETALISAVDIICAMISERPYRNQLTLLDALEELKKVMQGRFPAEFRLLVSYFQKILK